MNSSMGNIKTVNLSYHEESGNANRRVKYGDKNSFSRLVVSFSDGTTTRHFEFDASDLPDTDSIHLKFNPVTKSIAWSPKHIDSKVKELY